MSARRRALTDAEAWTIVCEPATDAETLGRRLGIRGSTVRNARARFRRGGWTCRVAYVPCRWCGGMLVQRGYRAGRAVWHDECRPLGRRVVKRNNDRQRWRSMPAPARDDELARIHDYTTDRQAATVAGAGNAGRRWTADDDTALLAGWQHPAHVTAAALGRSLYAVKARKAHHRRRGTAP